MQNNGDTGSAGAVNIQAATISSKFYNCRFENNRAEGSNNSRATGAIGIGGDGTQHSTSSVLIDGCEFIGNLGRNEGGAINARHNTIIQNSLSLIHI